MRVATQRETGAKHSRRPLIVALDIGTSSTRALLYDAHGRLQTGSERQYQYAQTVTADGGVSTDADSLYRLTIKALRDLLGSLDDATTRQIAGVAVSCFWHSLMGVDESETATTPLFSWADTRASQDASHLAESWDGDKYHLRTGCFLHSSYWPAKLTWLHRTDQEAFARVHRWISFADYMFLRLFGEPSCSVSTASGTGLYDPNALDWDEQSLRGLPISRAQLPVVVGNDFRACITKKTQRGLGCLRGVPWIAAYGDGAASNVGAGGCDDTRIVINIGTSGAIRIVAPVSTYAVSPALFAYRADEYRFVIGGAMSNGGNLYAWLRSNLKDADERQIEANRRRSPAGHGLTVLPFLAGERSPGWRPNAHGVVTGLNLHTSSLDISLAMMEAMAYPFYDVWRNLVGQFPRAQSVTISGGGFKHSPLLAGVFADVFGCDPWLCEEAESSARGAVLLASEALGLGNVERSPGPRLKRVHFDPGRHTVYRAAMDRYTSLYKSTFG